MQLVLLRGSSPQPEMKLCHGVGFIPFCDDPSSLLLYFVCLRLWRQ